MRRWQDDAACRGMDPELWFPVSDAPLSGAARRCLRLALDTCMACPVRQECLEFAVSTGQRGIWGGMTETMRRSARACRRLRAAALSG